MVEWQILWETLHEGEGMSGEKTLLMNSAYFGGLVCDRLLRMYQNAREEAEVVFLITHSGYLYRQHTYPLEVCRHFHCSREHSHASRVIPACFKILFRRSEPISLL